MTLILDDRRRSTWILGQNSDNDSDDLSEAPTHGGFQGFLGQADVRQASRTSSGGECSMRRGRRAISWDQAQAFKMSSVMPREAGNRSGAVHARPLGLVPAES